MTSEQIRSLLYPLGLLASVLFALRVMQQWIGSERKKKSHVTVSFWIISLTANLIMMVHSFIQLQYPVCIIQSLNGVIAWRNVCLIRGSTKSWKTALTLLFVVSFLVTALFLVQGWWFHTDDWMRPPTFPWVQAQAHGLSFLWHVVGLMGMSLFASRFWVQWWLAEKKKASVLGHSFWWISLIGACISIVYFYRLHDLVNLLSYSTGIIPYLRNLVLLRQKSSVPALQKNSVFVFAGEQSGDLLGGSLLKALKNAHPSLRPYGVGGRQMRAQGLHCILPMERFQVMGFSAVIKALPRLFSDFRQLQKRILKDRPAAVILIDYPDFNMRLEKTLRKKGYQGKLIHYVCPTVWAWRPSRVHTLAKSVDLLLSIFPFEKECFLKTPLHVSYVGHPLTAVIEQHVYQASWKEQFGLPPASPVIAIFPGSRRHEIETNLPLQLKAAEHYCKVHPDAKVAISVARPELEALIHSMTSLPTVLVPSTLRYELMKEAACAIATSGTVTLELALHATPTVVTYKLNHLNYFLGKYLFNIRLPHFCIVNIIGGKTIFPECIDRTLSAEQVFQELQTLVPSACKSACEEVKRCLQKGDASQKAAEAITHLIGEPA